MNSLRKYVIINPTESYFIEIENRFYRNSNNNSIIFDKYDVKNYLKDYHTYYRIDDINNYINYDLQSINSYSVLSSVEYLIPIEKFENVVYFLTKNNNISNSLLAYLKYILRTETIDKIFHE